MKKVLFFALVVFCTVKFDDIQAMEKPQGLTKGQLPEEVANFKKSLPDGPHGYTSTAKLALNNQINGFIDKSPQKDGSSTSIVTTDQAHSIVIDQGNNHKVAIEIPLDANNNPTLDNGYAIKYLEGDNVIAIEHFDSIGNQTIMSRVNNSWMIQSLQSMQQRIVEFVASSASRVKALFTLQNGPIKKQEEQEIVAEAVGMAIKDQDISPLEKQHLLQATYDELKILLSTGKFNPKTFYAWVLYPFDRMTELVHKNFGYTTTVVRNPKTGELTIRQVNNENKNVIDSVFQDGKLIETEPERLTSPLRQISPNDDPEAAVAKMKEDIDSSF